MTTEEDGIRRGRLLIEEVNLPASPMRPKSPLDTYQLFGAQQWLGYSSNDAKVESWESCTGPDLAGKCFWKGDGTHTGSADMILKY